MSCHKKFSSAFVLAIAFTGVAIDVLESQVVDHRSVLVRVVDADDQPVTDADVLLIYRNAFTVEETKFETDAGGLAIVELPVEAQRVTINILKSGYVPKANRWRIPGNEVPDALDFQVQKGTTIGGEVRNTRGEPVAGAMVAIKLHSPLTQFSDDGTTNDLFILEAKHAPVTDDDGRWTYSGIPADAEVRISITHPDYDGDQNFTTDYKRASLADRRVAVGLVSLTAFGFRSCADGQIRRISISSAP